MTPPLPPKGREPVDDARLREKVRDIVVELLAGTGAPSHAPAPASPWGATGAGWRRRRRVVLGVILGVLLAGAAVQAFSRTGLFPRGHQLPDELVGVWSTSAPRYADRAFQITKTSIAFGTGGHSYSVYPIRTVAVVRDSAATLYTIDYTTPEDQVAEFSFYYVPRREGEIRFKNQRQLVWRKAKP